MRIKAHSKLVMIGDSITDCERARPVGEGLFGAVGKGYVALVDAAIATARPDLHIRVVNMGASGNTVRDLKNRWESDVLALQPHWLSIMIGINDVWRQFDMPLVTECHVYPDEYEATLDELVAKTKPRLKGLVLMTPYYIEPNRKDAMRARMDEYGRVVRRLAKRHDTILVDTQAAFDRVLAASWYPAALAWDRVHPNLVGHMAIARAFLDAVGL
jgi:lysophospholipase L1-like esterase